MENIFVELHILRVILWLGENAKTQPTSKWQSQGWRDQPPVCLAVHGKSLDRPMAGFSVEDQSYQPVSRSIMMRCFYFSINYGDRDVPRVYNRYHVSCGYLYLGYLYGYQISDSILKNYQKLRSIRQRNTANHASWPGVQSSCGTIFRPWHSSHLMSCVRWQFPKLLSSTFNATAWWSAFPIEICKFVHRRNMTCEHIATSGLALDSAECH